jgi:hypothetical protein
MANVSAEIRTEHFPNASLEVWAILYHLFQFIVRNREHWNSTLLRKVCTRMYGGIIKKTAV